MNAIILAAGLGGRMGPLAANRPKCLLELRGRTILERQLDLLAASGVERVAVVVGHQGEAIRAVASHRAQLLEYPHFARTNNLHTLQHCGQLLEGAVVILFSDVLVERSALERCLAGPGDYALLVDTAQNRPDTMRVRRAGDLVIDLGAHVLPEDGHGNFIGIARLSAAGAPRLRAELDAMVRQGGFERAYYTQAFPRLAAAGQAIRATPVEGARWFEIDTPDDYARAQAQDFYVRW